MNGDSSTPGRQSIRKQTIMNKPNSISQRPNDRAEAGVMLELQNLSKSFRGIPAVENVSFKVAPGEIVGFLGPNGAGKSTTVKIITGMLRSNDGLGVFAYIRRIRHLSSAIELINTHKDQSFFRRSLKCWARASDPARSPCPRH